MRTWTASSRPSSSATTRRCGAGRSSVGGGVVLAASYEAKAYGVRGAMGGRLARRLCPDLIVVPPRMTAYTEASQAVFEVFERTTPLVEGISVDEAFLDVGGLRRISGTSVDIARHLRAEVRASVGLPISVGAAGTKFLAKVASAAAKPDGLLVVPLGGELDFLHPLPIERLWGVGPKTSPKLRDRGIRTVGELAMLGESTLAAIVGKASARHLHALASNRDPRHVRTGTREGRSGRSAPSGSPTDTPPRRSTPRCWPSSSASPAGCGPPGASAGRSTSACGSTTSAGPPGPTRCPTPRRGPTSSSPSCAACWTACGRWRPSAA